MRLLRGLNRLFNNPDREDRPFRKTLSFNDLWKEYLETGTDIIQLPQGRWTRVGEYIIKPQEQVFFGYGEEQYPENQGFMFLQFYDDTATTAKIIDGLVRLCQIDANELEKEIVFEGRTEILRGDPNDRNKMIPLPVQDHISEYLTYEDCKLVIELMSDRTVNLDKTPAARANIWNIPISVYRA